MTAFDDRLYRALVTLADTDGNVDRSARHIARMLDVSDRSIYASYKRLSETGKIVLYPNPEIGGITAVRIAPSEGIDKGVTLDQRPAAELGAASVNLPSDHPPQNSEAGPKRDVNRDCLMCEGSGWVELPDGTNTVEPCRCINPEWRRQWRDRRRQLARTWPRDAVKETDRPARADYMKLWAEYTRRRLSEIDPGAPPDIPPLRLVDPDEKF